MHPILPSNLDHLVAEYQRLWLLMPVLHSRIAKLAGKEAIRACAKRLHMFSKHAKTIGVHFEYEEEMDVFQDYLLYMYRPHGFNLVRQLFNRNLYAQGSDERRLLEGMVQARFSIFWVKDLHPSGGLIVFDVITGEDFFLLNQARSQQDVRGLLATFRIFPFHDVWMHTGANMTFGRIEDASELQAMGRYLTDQEERELNEANIHRWRALLREDA